MGMFDSNQPFDPSSFNYNTAEAQITRQRATAAALMASKQPTGQMVPGGPNGFYVKPGLMATFGPVIQQIIGAVMQGKQDNAQAALDKNSQAALAYQLQHMNDSVRDPNQDGVEAAAQFQREARRGQDTSILNPPDAAPVSDSSGSDTPVAGGATTAPINAGSANMTDLPVQSITPATKTAAVTALNGAPAFNAGKDSQAAYAAMPNGGLPPQNPNLPSDNSIIVPGAMDNIKAIAAKALQNAQHLTGADGQSPNGNVNAGNAPAAGNAPTAGPGGTTLTGNGASGSWDAPTALPPTPTGAALPSPGQPPATAAVAAPTAPSAVPPAVALASDPGMTQTQQGQVIPNQFSPTATNAPGMATTLNGQQTQISDPNPYSNAPTQAQMMARIAQLAQTGQAGSAMSSVMLSRMAPNYQKLAPGEALYDANNPGRGPLATAPGMSKEQQAADTNFNTYLQGKNLSDPQVVAQLNQVRLSQGLHPISAATMQVRAGAITADQAATQDRAKQTQSAAFAKSRLDNNNVVAQGTQAISNLDEIDALIKKGVVTGPAAALIPDLVASPDQQRYNKLMGQENFAGVRSAMGGATDSQGNQRFTGREFQAYEKNGGLQPSMRADAVLAQTAALRNLLRKQVDNATGYGHALDGISPPAAGQAPAVQTQVFATRHPGEAPQPITYNSLKGH